MATETLAKAALHETSLAVWEIPTAAAGDRFAVKIGAKSSGGCALGGCRIEVRDAAGAVVASGRLGDAPWPGTDALFWTEAGLRAPAEPGLAAFSVRFDAADAGEPHRDAASAFNVTVAAAPEHSLTVTVMTNGTPLNDAIVRLGPYRAMTDAAGIATVRAAKGRYELVMWKAGYDAPVMPLSIEADAAVRVDARAVPEDDPDSHWTA
jgi:hypothetical protein